jgi:DivIVA domain-containing protein
VRSAVTLNPQDIVRKEFREALRGYNQADVDLFLDDVVEEFTRLADENQKMKVRIAALQQEVARLRDGRGVSMPTGPAREDVERMESDVRKRVRRFLEEQIRMIDAAGPSTTAERIAREVPRAPEPAPEPPAQAPASQTISVEPEREPFWAGE